MRFFESLLLRFILGKLFHTTCIERQRSKDESHKNILLIKLIKLYLKQLNNLSHRIDIPKPLVFPTFK
jgi:hypothetical protein